MRVRETMCNAIFRSNSRPDYDRPCPHEDHFHRIANASLNLRLNISLVCCFRGLHYRKVENVESLRLGAQTAALFSMNAPVMGTSMSQPCR